MTPDALAALHARCFRLPPPWSAEAFAGMLDLPGCLLLTDTLIPILAPIPAGETSSELTFSLARQPGTFRVQHMHAVVGADGVARWFTSNAVRVTVP